MYYSTEQDKMSRLEKIAMVCFLANIVLMPLLGVMAVACVVLEGLL
jgi:hypothetical protein